MTIISFLGKADFAVTIFANVAVLAVAFPAYKRTKLLPFALFIWGCFGSIILSVALYLHQARGFISTEDERTFQELYRFGYLVLSIVGAIGAVLLVRRFMTMFDRKDDNAV